MLDPLVYLRQKHTLGWSPIIFPTTNYLFNQPEPGVFLYLVTFHRTLPDAI